MKKILILTQLVLAVMINSFLSHIIHAETHGSNRLEFKPKGSPALLNLRDKFASVAEFEKDDNPFKIIVFLSMKCPCSNSHLPHLNELSQKYKNVRFYGVITDIFDSKSKLALEGFYSGDNIRYPVIRDDEQNLIRKYGALKTPDIRILKKNGDANYEVIYEGGVTEQIDFAKSQTYFLEENLKSISQNTELKFRYGRSLGCYIRRI